MLVVVCACVCACVRACVRACVCRDYHLLWVSFGLLMVVSHVYILASLACTHTHTHTHTHMHTHTHTCTQCLDDFEMMKVLGEGTFGKVVLCKEKETGSLYAMKVLKKDFIQARDEMDHTMTEQKVMKNIRHPFLTVRDVCVHVCELSCYILGDSASLVIW